MTPEYRKLIEQRYFLVSKRLDAPLTESENSELLRVIAKLDEIEREKYTTSFSKASA